MSETFSRHRGLEPRGRDGAPGPSDRLDPLAELARLVGREDPFRDLFPNRDKTAELPPVQSARADRRLPTSQSLEDYQHEAHPDEVREPESLIGTPEHGEYAGHDHDDLFHAPLGQAPRESFKLPALPNSEPHFGESGPHAAYAMDAADAPELNADLWAQGMPETGSAEPLQFDSDHDVRGSVHDGSQKRTLVVLLAVVALTVGGLGATFLVRGGGTSVASEGDVPTIMADNAPNKVQPPDTSNQSTGGDGNTALIEKSASDNVANAKVVNTQEQPVDLSQLPPAPAAAAQPTDAQAVPPSNDGRVATVTYPAGSNPSPFPEPHRVKTILIRPDGSVVGEDQSPAAQAPSPSAGAAQTTSPAGGVARPSTPKSTARASSTPKAAASAADGVAAVKPKPAHAAPKPAAMQTAAADPAVETTASTTPAASAASGSFAVQLAAPGTEQEAKDISARLQKKFSSELGGHAPSIRKADKGDKSVYRVRVSNLSQDDAKALCSKLQASGGTCFVVRN